MFATLNEINVGQINLQKSKVASVELNKRDFAIVMITEPYNYRNNVCTVTSVTSFITG